MKYLITSLTFLVLSQTGHTVEISVDKRTGTMTVDLRPDRSCTIEFTDGDEEGQGFGDCPAKITLPVKE